MSSDDSDLGDDTVDSGRGNEASQSVPCYIQSFFRCSQKHSKEDDGSLLRARPDGSPKIDVDFKGTEFDEKTVFYLEKNDDAEANVLRYGSNYYLAVYNSEVKLRQSQHFPKKNKYLFRIESANSRYTFESVATEEHLHCDENGKATMRGLSTKDRRKDHQALFNLLSQEDEQLIKFGKEVVTDKHDSNDGAVSETSAERPEKETSLEDSVKGNSVDIPEDSLGESGEVHPEDTHNGLGTRKGRKSPETPERSEETRGETEDQDTIDAGSGNLKVSQKIPLEEAADGDLKVSKEMKEEEKWRNPGDDQKEKDRCCDLGDR